MSDDERLEEEVFRKHGMTREQYLQVQSKREWETRQMSLHVRGIGRMTDEAGTHEEYVADKIAKEIQEKRTKKAEQENIEGWLQVLHQDQGRGFFLKVMVDTGATVNAITHGMLIDHQLENRIIKLKEPLDLDCAVGSFQCDEMISIPWVGKGNQRHDADTFYVLPRGQANIDKVILSKEWLNQRDLLCNEDERHGQLKPLFGGRQSAPEKAAREQVRQQAMSDQASSSKAKDAYQKRGGQKDQESSSAGTSRPKEGGK